MTAIPVSHNGYPLTPPNASPTGQAFSPEALTAAGWPSAQVAGQSNSFSTGYQPTPQPLFAQQATTASPFRLRGEASDNPASFLGANQALVDAVQQNLAQQGISLSTQDVLSLMPREAAFVSQELGQSTSTFKAQLEAQRPKQRTLLQNVIEFGAPIIAGVGTTFLTGGNVFLGAAAAAGTAGLINEQIQKGAFSDNYDPNRKIDQAEKWISVGTNLIPVGIGSAAGKVVAAQVAKKGLLTSAAAQSTVQFATQGAIRGSIAGGGVQFAREVQNGEDLTSWDSVRRIAGASIQGAGTGAVFSAALGNVKPLNFSKSAARPEASSSNNYVQATVGTTAQSAKEAALGTWQAPGNAVKAVKNKL